MSEEEKLIFLILYSLHGNHTPANWVKDLWHYYLYLTFDNPCWVTRQILFHRNHTPINWAHLWVKDLWHCYLYLTTRVEWPEFFFASLMLIDFHRNHTLVNCAHLCQLWKPLRERLLILLSILDIPCWVTRKILLSHFNLFSQESYPGQLCTSLSEILLTLLSTLDNSC